MSSDIVKESMFLLYSIRLGIIITFVYDWLRVARRVVRHRDFAVSIEDFLFWSWCFVMTFLMLYQENNGILRWFSVIGAALGMFLYRLTVGRFFVKFLSKFILWIKKWIYKILCWIMKPIKHLVLKWKISQEKLYSKGLRDSKRAKKKLTEWLKMVKIILCKQ